MPQRNMLTEVRGDLVLAALCIGQFRAPCQIEDDRLLVRADEALRLALGALGLTLCSCDAEAATGFTPAPLFAPDPPLVGAAVRRQVHTHISRHHDDDAPDEEAASASNAWFTKWVGNQSPLTGWSIRTWRFIPW